MTRLVDVQILDDPKKSWKYRGISKRARYFTVIYNKFITDNNISLNYSDYFACLRTHLLFEKFSLKKISKYINTIVLPNLTKVIKLAKEINSSIKEL